jgi:hypothetical protein
MTDRTATEAAVTKAAEPEDAAPEDTAGIQPVNRGGRPRALMPDAETLWKLNYFGLKGFGKAECSRRLGVDRETLRKFFDREPLALKAYEDGLKERSSLLLTVQPAPTPPAIPKPGEICPACGGRVGAGEDTITISRAALADARRKFENIIDREIAAREAEIAQGNGR